MKTPLYFIKGILVSLFVFFVSAISVGQTIVYNEDFETAPYMVTPSGVPIWAVSTSVQVSGTSSYTNMIAFNDSSMFVTDAVDLTGYNFVLLDFDHICKIEYFDAAEIFISIDNGVNWVKLTSTEYINANNSQFGASGDKFTANSYPLLWLPSQHGELPTNSWWMNEQFNVSAIAGNQTQVRFMFKMRDGNSNGSNTNAGWFLDDIKIIASPYELIPPTITLNAPILQDTVYSAGPFTIGATITDASGISQADLIFRLDSTLWDTIAMTDMGSNVWEADIPAQPYNTVVDYYVRAIDASLSYNEAETMVKTFVTKKPAPVVIIGTGTQTQYYIPCYGFYDYGWSGSLYTAAEINANGVIDSIGFYVNNSVAAYMMNNQSMYLAHRPYTFYDAAMNTMPDVMQYTQIYTGNVTWTGPGWYMFKLQTPFIYNGSQTLEVVWMNYDGSYTGGYPTFAATTMGQSMAKYKYADWAMPTNAGTLTTSRPNLKIVFMPNDNDYDAGIVAIPEPTGVVITGTPYDVKVNIKNYGIQTLTDVNIEWEINGTPQTAYTWSGTLLEDVVSGDITIGSSSFVLGTNTIRAWTSNPNMQPDENTLNDTLETTVFGCDNILNGVYSVNSTLPSGSGNFNTLNDAMAALTTCGINGPVVFELYDSTYNQTLVFGEIPGSSAVNTVTFKPAAGNNVLITASSADATIRFNATKNVIFDGSNNGTNSVNMTIRNTSTAVNTAAVWLSSIGATLGQGCENITLKNCQIEAGSITVSSTFGVYIGGTTISTSGTGNYNNSVIIQNNIIKKAYYGIYARSASPNLNTGLMIVENEIGSVTPADYIIFRGIDIQGATSPVISGNYIHNMRTTSTVSIAAIDLGQYVTGALIDGNNITGLRSRNTGGYGAYGINVSSSVGVSNILIANNFISDILTSKYSATSTTYNPFGIRLTGGNGVKVYNNSIHLFGEPSTGTAASMSSCFLVTAVISNLDVRNNIFSNSMTGAAGTKSYAIHKSSSTAFTSINYNDYYVSGSYGILGYSGTADVTSLSAWQTVTSQDVNSIDENPDFVGNTNLHTFASSVNNKAISLPEVTQDIDGDPRDPSTPDIGADEFTPLAWDLRIMSIVTPANTCGLTATEPVILLVKNNGSNTITTFNATYILDGGTPVTETFTITIEPDSIREITFTQTIDLSDLETYELFADLDLASDMYTDNDTMTRVFTHGHNFTYLDYTMGFELTEPYGFWSKINVNGDASLWQYPFVGSTFAHSGNNSAKFVNSTANPADDYLFSRCFTMYAGEVYEISYWRRAENASYPQDLDLKVASGTPEVASVISSIYTETGINSTAYQQIDTVFTVPADGIYYFVWHAKSPATAYGCFVDDINISLLPPQEASVIDISSATSGCTLGNEDISIDIFNSGSQIINGNLTANYQVGSGSVVSENVVTPINVGDTLTYTFATQIDFTVTTYDSLFNIVAWVELLNDPVSFNDSINNSVMSMHTPTDPTVENDTVFYGNQATLVAHSTAQIYWFDDIIAVDDFHTGDTLVTGPLYVNTTYWVESSNAVLEEDSLQTTFAAGNGCSGGNMFDVTSLGDEIIITGFHINPSVTQANLPVNVYYKSGTYIGSETNAAAWTLVGNYTVNATAGVPTYFDCDDFAIPPGATYGIYVEYNANYTTVSGLTHYANADINITAGVGLCGSFSSVNNPRAFNGIVHYKKEVPGCTSNRVPVTAVVELYQWEAGIIELNATPDGCADATEPVSVTIVNYGYGDITGTLTASYTVNGGSAVIENVSGTILAGDTLVYEFTTPLTTGLSGANPDSTYTIVAWIELTGDVFNSNDTLTEIKSYNYTPDDPVISDVDIPYGTSATLNATSTVDLTWYSDPPTTPIFTGNPYITPVLYDTTYYWVQAGLTLSQHYTFDVDLEGWTASDPCNLGYTWAWDSDGGLGTAKMVNASTTSAAILMSPLYNINADSVYLSFVHRLNAESCCDEYYVVYSLDGGPWTTFIPTTGNYNTTGYISNNPFSCGSSISSQPAFYSLYNYMTSSGHVSTQGASTLQIAFVGTSDSSVGIEGWFIDEVTVEAGGCQSDMVRVAVNVTGYPNIDVGPIDIVTPISGFNLGSETVRVEVKNYGTDPVSNIPISYQVNGGTPVTETITTTIPSGDSYIHQFSTPFIFGAFGGYDFTVYTHLATDLILVNDTLQETVNNNALIYCDSYATSPASYGDIGNVTVSNLNNGLATPIFSNPAATGGYSDFTTSLPPVEFSQGASYPMSVTVIYTSSSYYTYYTKAFIDYNQDGTFDPVNELVFQGQTASLTNTVITGTVNVPLTAMSGYTRMRIVCVETSTPSTVQPCGTYTWGETEDYTVVIAPQLPQDAGVSAINSPAAIYSEGESVDVIVTLRNYGTDPLTSIPVTYQHNANAPVTQTWTGNLLPGTTVQFTMTPLIVENGSNSICAYTEVPADSNYFNDESCGTFWGLPGVIFFEDNFEGSTVFTTTGTVWEHGEPAGVVINTAFEGDTCWVTNLDGAYPAMCTEYLVSPTMNFTGIYDAYFSLGYWMHGEINMDGGNIQYSTNNGITWTTLGVIDDTEGYNWYDTYVGALPSWSEPTGGWKAAFISLSALDNAGPNVKFRFVFRSNATVQNEGFAVDEVKIHVPQIAVDAGVIAIENPVGQSATGSANQVRVRIKNFGSTTLTSIPVSYRISTGAPPVNAIWTGSLAPGEDTLYTFATTFIGPFVDYTLCSYTAVAADIYKFNDTICDYLTPGQAAIDGAVTSIVSPTVVNPAGQSVQVTIQITNHGTNALTNFPVQFSVNGATQTTEIVAATLNSGASMNYTFITSYNSPGVDHELCAKTAIPSDAVPNNDQLCNDMFVSIDESVSQGISLMQNVPNPASDMTTIGFSIPEAAKVTFTVVNVLGQSLLSQTSDYDVGKHTINLNTQNLAPGVYYYSITVNETTLTRKMTIQ